LRTSLTRNQSEILDSDKKNVRWLFDIDMEDGIIFHWSLSDTVVNIDSTDVQYDFKIIDFSSLVLQMPQTIDNDFPENKITVECSFKDSNIDGYYASDFEGKQVLVRLVISSDLRLDLNPEDIELEEDEQELENIQEEEILSWKFVVESANSVDQILHLECKDFFSYYLDGDYPNTPLISEIFPNNIMKEDNICVPILFGNPYVPLRWCVSNIDAVYSTPTQFYIAGVDLTDLFTSNSFITCDCGGDGLKYCYVTNSMYNIGNTYVNLSGDTITDNIREIIIDNYLLGSTGKTYTISEIRSPQEFAGRSIYSSGAYTFKQYDIGSYRMSQILIDDSDNDGTNDANGFWGNYGKEVFDVPFYISSSDLSSTKNPIDIISYIVQDWGLSSSDIDSDSATDASTILNSRGILLNCGLHYRMNRKDLLGKLSYISGIIPVYRDKIYFKVLTSDNQLDIEEYLLQPHSFSISSNSTFIQKNKDSGYVLWQTAGLPQDKVNKAVIPAKTTYTNRSDITLECEWLPTEEIALKSGILALQRDILVEKTINFTAKAKILKLEPGDFIRLKNQNQNVENNVPYSALITKMTINKGLWIDVECQTFSDNIDDWDDIIVSENGAEDVDTDNGYSLVYQGPIDNGNAINKPNSITSNVLIGANGELKTNNDPSSNGGFVATNSAIRCYNEDGNIRFEVIYSGAEQGDVTIGDYSGNRGLKWDQGLGSLNIISDSTDAIHLYNGGDLLLEGSDTNPGRIKFEGTSFDVEIGSDVDGSRFIIKASDDNQTDFIIGGTSWWGNYGKFKIINLFANDSIQLETKSADDLQFGTVYCNAPVVKIYSKDGVGNLQEYNFLYDAFYPLYNSLTDLGTAASPWLVTHTENLITYNPISPVVLAASANAAAPIYVATKGSLHVTSAGILYINTDGAGAWQKVGGQ